MSNLNSSTLIEIMENVTQTNHRHVGLAEQTIITISYLIGIIGNITALVLLHRSDKTVRNKSLTLMLKCLLCNDFIAVAGMLIQMYVQLYSPVEVKKGHVVCAIRVFWRTFGFGSGSVAIVMAIDRSIALIDPFAYHKHVTYRRIAMSIFSLWGIVTFIACLPLMGIGLYWGQKPDDPNSVPQCLRYRDGTALIDRVYTFIVFSYGLMMCLCIVICNLAVVIVLCKLSKRHHANALGTLRHQLSQNERQPMDSNREIKTNTRRDEINFAKLMVIYGVLFVISWVPQFFIIMISQLNPTAKPTPLYRLGDICLTLNFILDPCFYVLFRHFQQKRLGRLSRTLCKPFCLARCRPPSSSSSGYDNEMNDINTDKTSTSSKLKQSS